MSRESRRSRRAPDDELDDDYDASQPSRVTARPAARRRWPLRLFLFLFLLGVLIWFAPMMLCRTSLLQRAIDVGAADLQGRVVAGSASLGWLAPVRLNDIVVYDAEKNTLLTVAGVESQKSLLSLITDSSRPGLFRIERPKLNLVLRADGSNLEDALAPLLQKPSSGKSVEVAVEIVDGAAEITDAAAGTKWLADGLNLELNLPADPSQPLDAKLKTQIAPAEAKDAGTLAATLQWERGAAGEVGGTTGLGQGKLGIQSQALPLACLEPLLHRFAGQYRVAGWLTCDASYEWSAGKEKDSAPVQTVEITDMSGEKIAVSAPALLGNDELRIDRINAAGRIALQGDRCDLRKLEVASDFARLEADGAVSLRGLNGKSTATALLAVLQEEDFQVAGEVDLAQLAQLLPGTLRIREGTQITSGKISAKLASRQEEGRRRWDGNLESSNLTADDHGRKITWEQPVNIALAAHQSPTGPVIEQLECTASFLKVTARGTLSQGDAALQGDLSQLVTELDRFVDLGNLQLAGQLQGGLQWQQSANDQVAADGQVTLQDFQLASSGVRPWTEKQLVVSLKASGVAQETALARIDTATVRVQSGTDEMEAQLRQPVDNPSAKSDWPIQARLVGDLATWLPRVQVLYPLTGWQISGTIDMTETGTISPQQVRIETAALKVEQLRAYGSGLFLDEPLVKTDVTDALVDPASGHVAAKTITLASSALAFRANDVTVNSSARGPSVNAAIGFRGDLARVNKWFQDPAKPIEQQVAGQAVGQLQFAFSGDSTTADWDTEVENFSFANLADAPATADPRISPVPVIRSGQLKTVWTEPKLRFTGKGTYDMSQDTLQLASCDLTGDSVRLTTKGTLSEPSRRCVVDLQGELGYDLQTVAAVLRPYLGESFDITGRDSRPFALRGPLRDVVAQSTGGIASKLASVPSGKPSSATNPPAWLPAELNAQASVGWKSISAYGLPIGPGDAQATLENGVVKFVPFDLAVSEGRLKIAPQVLLNRASPVLIAERGPVLEQVRISPELCKQWLKFVTPILADVTQVDGKFSLALTETAVIPFEDFLAGEAQGELNLHSAQVGPGPMAQEILWMAQAIKGISEKNPLAALGGVGAAPTQQQKQWVVLPEQKIPFHWKDRRVYHEGLQIAFDNVVIRTKGSVGLDQTLDLVAEVPVRDEWLARDRTLASSLQGQMLQIPIGGTMSRPRVDRRILEQITKQTITNSANKLLENGLNRGLEKFLPQRK